MDGVWGTLFFALLELILEIKPGWTELCGRLARRRTTRLSTASGAARRRRK
ncbi:MAG: hypothetical protein HUU22_19245 [Phycisphaerae bacterium]|nr:hypothetical protein [Phycisphaerae bacterium]NUQ48155.1 hypothetical protein [Phycisphaerae bacterium]